MFQHALTTVCINSYRSWRDKGIRCDTNGPTIIWLKYRPPVCVRCKTAIKKNYLRLDSWCDCTVKLSRCNGTTLCAFCRMRASDVVYNIVLAWMCLSYRVDCGEAIKEFVLSSIHILYVCARAREVVGHTVWAFRAGRT